MPYRCRRLSGCQPPSPLVVGLYQSGERLPSFVGRFSGRVFCVGIRSRPPKLTLRAGVDRDACWALGSHALPQIRSRRGDARHEAVPAEVSRGGENAGHCVDGCTICTYEFTNLRAARQSATGRGCGVWKGVLGRASKNGKMVRDVSLERRAEVGGCWAIRF